MQSFFSPVRNGGTSAGAGAGGGGGGVAGGPIRKRKLKRGLKPMSESKKKAFSFPRGTNPFSMAAKANACGGPVARVDCPSCNKLIPAANINAHLDSCLAADTATGSD